MQCVFEEARTLLAEEMVDYVPGKNRVKCRTASTLNTYDVYVRFAVAGGIADHIPEEVKCLACDFNASSVGTFAVSITTFGPGARCRGRGDRGSYD